MTYAYIISKTADPIFALSIGVAAALTRIHRDETEKSRTPAQTVEVLRRRWGVYMGGGGEGGEGKA